MQGHGEQPPLVAAEDAASSAAEDALSEWVLPLQDGLLVAVGAVHDCLGGLAQAWWDGCCQGAHCSS